MSLLSRAVQVDDASVVIMLFHGTSFVTLFDVISGKPFQLF